ncbi:MAG: hypothetical protein FLDDKLPJ_01863 [Phycisphaerae bacterium]|nr:hypothetical protein [Phycisphaerae bacterium]
MRCRMRLLGIEKGGADPAVSDGVDPGAPLRRSFHVRRRISRRPSRRVLGRGRTLPAPVKRYDVPARRNPIDGRDGRSACRAVFGVRCAESLRRFRGPPLPAEGRRERARISGIRGENSGRFEPVKRRWRETRGIRARSTPRKKSRNPADFLVYSGSVGSLNNAGSLMLPCPNCGKPGVLGSPGFRLLAVSSGGNRTSELRKSRINARRAALS